MNISIFCNLGTKNCQWTCCVSFDCFQEHAKHYHNEFYKAGAATIFSSKTDFALMPLNNDYDLKKHTIVCDDGRK